MDSRKRTLQSPVAVTCRRGIACLSLICALQMLPQTVLANDSAAQVNPTDFAAQIELTDSDVQIEPTDVGVQAEPDDAAVQAEPVDAAVQAEPVDAAVQAEPTDTLVQTEPDDAAAQAEPDDVAAQAEPDDVAAQNNSADSAEATLGLEGAGGNEADVNSAASDDAAPHENEDKENNVPEAGTSDDDATAPDGAVTRDDRMTDDADTEKTKDETLMLSSVGDSLVAAGEFPSRFDLRDLGLVTPVKLQSPWGTCWAFGATAAAEISILSEMGKTYAETGLDLSERYLVWYFAQPVTESISTSQAGEGLHLYDENPNNIFMYGGKDKSAGTLYAQGIGPVPESEYPYRGIEGKLSYETLLTEKDAFIETSLEEYKKTYPYISEDVLRSLAEIDYENNLSRYAVYDAYSQYDDWTISEADEPGSGRLRGAPYTLIDNNVFIYWVDDDDGGIDKFGKEPLVVVSKGYTRTKFLYQDSIDQIKAELTSGHGVSVDIKINANTLNTETWAQYYDGLLGTSPHGVCIVGWDDNYPASNFNNLPPGNGAWIVKNSWGSQTDLIQGGLVTADGTAKDANGGNWGIVDENGLHTGYFYLSYYDEGIGVPESYVFDLRENHDLENALQLDYMPASAEEWGHKTETPMWCANVFTLDKDMRIDEVATRFTMCDEVPLTGFTVTFDIYCLRDGAETPVDGELLASCTREFGNNGYHRTALDAPVYGKAGERLAVVVQHRYNYEDGSTKYVVNSQETVGYKSDTQLRRDPLYGTPIVNEGESFLKIVGVTEKEEVATEGWLDLCAPFSKEFLWYLKPDIADNAQLAEYYESRAVGNPIYTFFYIENFGIKAFGESVTLEHVDAVTATCEEAGRLEYWRDPLSDALFADRYGIKPLTSKDLTVNPLGHAWGNPTYTWAGDNSSVTARSICRRNNEHVLEEAVDTTSNTKDGKITWTAQFENGIFTTQTRSAGTEPVPGDPDEKTPSSQSKADVRTCTVNKVYAAPAGKTSDSTVIHAAPVATGDDTDSGLWYTLLAGALACIVTLLAQHRGSRRPTICG